MIAVRSALPTAAVCLTLCAATDAQTIAMTSPSPGWTSPKASVECTGVVIGLPGPAPATEVYFRTRYPDGSLCPPIGADGANHPGELGWSYPVDWDELTGIGTFTGRVKWLASGTNHLDVYLPTSPLGSPDASLTIGFSPIPPTVPDVLAYAQPLRRSLDTVAADGSAGSIVFALSVFNTSAEPRTLEVGVDVTLPDQTVLALPLGGPGVPLRTFTLQPDDTAGLAVSDPTLLYRFALDEPPFGGPPQEGLYTLDLRVYEDGEELYDNLGTELWITDRSDAPFRDVTDSTVFADVFFQGIGTLGNGLAAFDFDGDGLTDVFAAHPGGPEMKLNSSRYLVDHPGQPNRLFQNLGDGTFADVTAAAGVGGTGASYSTGVAWGDVDADGDNDLVVGNRDARPYVYRNDGDGTFSEVGATAVLGNHTNVGVPRFGDVDGDGDLDLYLGTIKTAQDSTWHPPVAPNVLLLNGHSEGFHDPTDPTFPLFVDVSTTSGVAEEGPVLGAFFWDYDRDGNLDLAAHYNLGAFLLPTALFRGQGDGTFTNVATATGYDVREFAMGACARTSTATAGSTSTRPASGAARCSSGAPAGPSRRASWARVPRRTSCPRAPARTAPTSTTAGVRSASTTTSIATSTCTSCPPTSRPGTTCRSRSSRRTRSSRTTGRGRSCSARSSSGSPTPAAAARSSCSTTTSTATSTRSCRPRARD